MTTPKKPRQWNSTLPRPSKPLRAKKPVKSRNPKRHAANLSRAHGDPAFRAWIKARRCVACGRTPCDAAHLKSGGTGRKDSVTGTVPLCSDYFDQGAMAYGCHAKYDGRAPGWGKKTFRARHAHVDLEALAAETQSAWEASRGLTHISEILPAALRGLTEGQQEEAS